jgi:hypothetical protein
MPSQWTATAADYVTSQTTLATAGAVLLVIAVGSERRTGKGKGAAARLRDLK